MTHFELPQVQTPAQELAEQYIAAVYVNGQSMPAHTSVEMMAFMQNGLPTLVMVHGWGADHRSFLPLVESLSGCNILLIDLPGFGVNTVYKNGHTHVCAEIASILPPISLLIGWSLGGMLLPYIVSYAEQMGKTVCGTVSLAANTQFVRTPNTLDGGVAHHDQRLTEQHYPHAMDDEQYSAFVDAFTHTPQALLKHFYRTQIQGDKNARAVKAVLTQCAPDFENITANNIDSKHHAWLEALRWLSRIDHTPYFKHWTVPALHILGEHDVLVPSVIADLFNTASHQKAVVLNGVSHAPHVSDPQKVAQYITAFTHQVLGINHIDKTQLAQSFGQAAGQYHQAAFFQKDMAHALCEQAGEMAGTVVDLGCGTGFCGHILQNRPNPPAHLVALDLSLGMLLQANTRLAHPHQHTLSILCADIEHLPFKPNSIDHFVSNMSMQWCDNLQALFDGAYQSLKPGGQFVFTTLGPKSLYELKTAWQQADIQQGKPAQHVNDFHSLAIVTTQAKQAGFEITYAQSRAQSVEYPSVKALLLDLKRVGAHNMSSHQKQGLMGKAHFNAMLHAYDAFKTPKSTYPLTYEMLFVTLKKN